MRIISGQYGGRSLKTVQGPGYRPATSKVRQAVFSMLEARGMHWPEARVLDCFAGSGSLGFEALSRGASLAWFVEKNKAAARCIRDNALALGLEGERWRVIAKDLLPVLRQPPSAGFHVVFIDPPYGKKMLEPALRALLDKGWTLPGAMVLAEVETRLPLDPATLDPRLEPLTDRTYGQTRIVLWQTPTETSPSTPAPSIP
jgi:16S rRNA (guanine966-N2)-methyltransferase